MDTIKILHELVVLTNMFDPEFHKNIELSGNFMTNKVTQKSISISLDENPAFFMILFEGKPVVYDTPIHKEEGIIQYFSVETPHDAYYELRHLLH